jgi:DNA-binding CsgD family transcriptional regulator
MCAFNEADKYISKGILLSQQKHDFRMLQQYYNNKFNNSVHLQDTVTAIAAAESMQRLPSTNDPGLIFQRQRIFALSMLLQGKYDQMRLHLDTCRQLFDGHENKDVRLSYLNAMSWYELKTKGQISDAAGVREGVEYFKRLHNYFRVNEFYNILVADAANRGNYQDAYRYEIEQFNSRDTLWNNEERGRIHELFIHYQIKEKEQQIASLEREGRLAAQRNVLIGSLLLFMLIAVVYYAIRRSHKQRLELDELTRILLERNTQLSKALERTEADAHVQHTDKGDDSELFNLVILTEADWERFQASFNKAYPGFLQNLRMRHPDITAGEMRLVLLDKLGLSQKEAATILGVSIDAVKKGRYRMKKKFNLPGDDFAGI